MLTIYVNNKPLFLIDGLENSKQKVLQSAPDVYFSNDTSVEGIDRMFDQLQNSNIKFGYLYAPSVSQSLKALKQKLTLIQAGGGLVVKEDKEILLIFRRGKWDLPKGKLDQGEDLATCALREVTEETGLKSIEILKPLVVTYHTYWEKDKHILKESHWYLMKTSSAEALIPQTEEDIEKCEWVPISTVNSYFSDMHASIIDVLKTGLQAINRN